MGWRGFIWRSKNWIIAFIGFAAGLVSLIPFIQDAAKPEVAADFLFESQQIDALNVRVTNKGKESISVNIGTVTVTGQDGSAIGELTVEKHFFHSKAILLEPDHSGIVTYYLTGYNGWVFASPDAKCSLELSFYGKDRRGRFARQAINCADIQDFSFGWAMMKRENGNKRTGVLP